MASRKESAIKRLCCNCAGEYEDSNYFKAVNKLYYSSGYLPMCKSCMTELLNTYIEKYQDKKKAMQRICMAFNLYYIDAIFESVDCDDALKILNNYFRQLNMAQYKNKTFDNTLDDGFEFGESNTKQKKNAKNKEDDEQDEEIDPRDIEKWGDGFHAEDYRAFNNHYKFLTNANPQCDGNQEIFILELCYTKMQQMKALRAGDIDNYNKLTESYRKSFNASGLKTVKDTSSTDDFTMGVGIETIEKFTPAEYYKDKALYKDFDNIGDYATRFIFRPLRNLMHGTHDRDSEFYVRDEEDDADES